MRKSIDLRQSEPGAFPQRFGREERLKNSRQDVGRDADSGIGHRQGNELFFKVTLSADSVMTPPPGIASRALTAILTSASSSSAISTSTSQTSAAMSHL